MNSYDTYKACYGSGLKLNEGEFYAFFQRYIETAMATPKSTAKDIIDGYGWNLDDGNDLEDMINEILDEIFVDEVAFVWSTDISLDVCHARFFTACVASPSRSDSMFFQPYYTNNKPNLYFVDKEEKTQNPDYISQVSLRHETSYVFYSDHKLDSVDVFESRPYNSYQEFRQEFQDKMAAYLPDDFDWDAHIGTFSYACS